MSSPTLTLRYARDTDAVTSTGDIRIHDDTVSSTMSLVLASFDSIPFRKMIHRLSEVLQDHPTAVVVLERSDNPSLSPYTLDVETATLIQTDPVAAVSAMEFTQSPSTGELRAKQERVMVPTPPLAAGILTLVGAFGPLLYFRIREHELECPGCGFWGIFASPSMLKDPDRSSTLLRTVFRCSKRCKQRIYVSCEKEWGWVSIEDLLKTPLERFFFPRAWNNGAWISRENLVNKFNAYNKELEDVQRH